MSSAAKNQAVKNQDAKNQECTNKCEEFEVTLNKENNHTYVLGSVLRDIHRATKSQSKRIEKLYKICNNLVVTHHTAILCMAYGKILTQESVTASEILLLVIKSETMPPNIKALALKSFTTNLELLVSQKLLSVVTPN